MPPEGTGTRAVSKALARFLLETFSASLQKAGGVLPVAQSNLGFTCYSFSSMVGSRSENHSRSENSSAVETLIALEWSRD